MVTSFEPTGGRTPNLCKLDVLKQRKVTLSAPDVGHDRRNRFRPSDDQRQSTVRPPQTITTIATMVPMTCAVSTGSPLACRMPKEVEANEKIESIPGPLLRPASIARPGVWSDRGADEGGQRSWWTVWKRRSGSRSGEEAAAQNSQRRGTGGGVSALCTQRRSAARRACMNEIDRRPGTLPAGSCPTSSPLRPRPSAGRRRSTGPRCEGSRLLVVLQHGLPSTFSRAICVIWSRTRVIFVTLRKFACEDFPKRSPECLVADLQLGPVIATAASTAP